MSISRKALRSLKMSLSVEEALRSRVYQLEKLLTNAIIKIELISDFLENTFSGTNFHFKTMSAVTLKRLKLTSLKMEDQPSTVHSRSRARADNNGENNLPLRARVSELGSNGNDADSLSDIHAATLSRSGSDSDSPIAEVETRSSGNVEEHQDSNNVHQGTDDINFGSQEESYVHDSKPESALTKTARKNGLKTRRVPIKDQFRRRQSQSPSSKVRKTCGKSFKCTWQDCQRKFKYRSNLQYHLRVHAGEKPFKCTLPQCERCFASQGNLDRHLAIHIGEKRFKCSWAGCSKSFITNRELTNHRRCHTGERPYSCPFCDRSCTQSSNLASHMRIHTGEKPYKCDICGVNFKDKSSLQNHEKSRHLT